jgi:hypothetical protein
LIRTADEWLAPEERLPLVLLLPPADRPAVAPPEDTPLLLPLNRVQPPDWGAVPLDAAVPRFGWETLLVEVDGFTPEPLEAACAGELVLAAGDRAARLPAERAIAWRC